MKKLAISFGMLTLVAVFMVGATALLPARAEAGCSPIIKSVTGWGTASTCQASRNACEADAENKAEANCYFGVCDIVSLTFTNNCVPHQGGFMSDCVLRYKCTFQPFNPY